MSDNSKPDETRIAQGRSPAYPYIDLEKAIERSDQIRATGAPRQALPPEAVYKIWGVGAASSGSRQSMAALNHFGLVDYIGRGDDRKVKLSDLALRIVLDKQPGSKERAAAVREAALVPPIHRELYEKYGAFLPADVVMETYLVRDRGYNEQAAQSLIEEYKATLHYAGLDKPDNMSVSQDGAEDNVNVNKGQETDWGKATDALGRAPPGMRHPQDDADGPLPPGMRRAVFNVAEGDVRIEFPEGMSKDSVEDLQGYVNIWFNKLRRDAGTSN